MLFKSYSLTFLLTVGLLDLSISGMYIKIFHCSYGFVHFFFLALPVLLSILCFNTSSEFFFFLVPSFIIHVITLVPCFSTFQSHFSSHGLPLFYREVYDLGRVYP